MVWAFLSQLVLFGLGAFLMLIVLLQRGRGGGLAGAFGGLGGQSAFGTKAGDVFTKITCAIAVVWVLVAGGSGYILRAAAQQRSAELGEGESLDESGELAVPDSPTDLPDLGELSEPNLPPAVPTGEADADDADADDADTDATESALPGLTPPVVPDTPPPESESTESETTDDAAPAVPETSDEPANSNE